MRTEEAIRAAAINLIAERGFAAVTLRELARKVGIQAGSLYRYYPSKNDLLLTIMVGHMEDVLAKWRSEKPRSTDPLVRLRAFIDFHVRYHVRRQKEVFIGNMEIRNLIPEHHRIVAALRSEYESELGTILKDGVDCGILRVHDIKVATFAILAMLTGLTAWYRESGRLSKDQLVDCYRRLILDGVKARSDEHPQEKQP
jgi:AcrR family transcriptional regulator